MKHYELNIKFFKQFKQAVNQLKKTNPEYSNIEIDYIARTSCILVTLLGNEDLLETYNDDLYDIPQMFENLKIV